MRFSRLLGQLGLVLLAGAALGGTVMLGLKERTGPVRCPSGTVPLGPRCCAEGQTEERGRCIGTPSRCPRGFVLVGGTSPGCAIAPRRVRIEAGVLQLGASDWQTRESQAQEVQTRSFLLDVSEVTFQRWESCVEAGICRALPGGEPGLPVTGVTADEAQRFCHFVGGRLPTGAEWLQAAFGAEGRRYPWGPTGLVCRRAVFGLVRGPCAQGATGPDWAGLRPDGATRHGVLDLAGNVAEWTVEPDGHYLARGGSYRSELAGELQSWAHESVPGSAPYVGFRCVYDLPLAP